MLLMFFRSYKQPELVPQDPYLAESINLTGEQTQVIGGESITRPCWLWEDVYKYPNGQEAFIKWRKLDIKYVRPATDPQDATVNLYDTFKDLGYNATGSYRTANIEEAIVDDGVSVKVRFGARTMGTFTESPSSFTCTYRISFNCSIETVTIDGVDQYRVTIANVDTGAGVKTVSAELIVYRTYAQFYDVWTEYDTKPTLD